MIRYRFQRKMTLALQTTETFHVIWVQFIRFVTFIYLFTEICDNVLMDVIIYQLIPVTPFEMIFKKKKERIFCRSRKKKYFQNFNLWVFKKQHKM